MKFVAPLLLVLFWDLAALCQTQLYPGQQIILNGQLTTVVTWECASNTSWGANTANAIAIGDASSRKYLSSSNSFPYSLTVCTLGMYLHRVGTGTAGNLTAEIRTNAAGAPGGVIATSLNTIGTGDTSSSDAWAIFNFTGQSLTNDTIYWFGLVDDTISATDYYLSRGGATSSGMEESSANGTTWSQAGTRKWYQSAWAIGPVNYPATTNSFELLINFESGSAGTVTTNGWTNSFKIVPGSALAGGYWKFLNQNNDTDAVATNDYQFASVAQMTFPSNYWWSNSLVADAGTLGLALTYNIGTNTTDWVYQWPTPVEPISFGLYSIVNATNTGNLNFQYFDMIYFTDISAHNIAAVEYRADHNTFYAHGLSNNVIVNGSEIFSNSIPTTNWLTGLITSSNYTLAQYDVNLNLVGTSVVGRATGGIVSVTFLERMGGGLAMTGVTNYFDNLVIKTNGLFPILPTNFPAMKNP